ncbi:SDR family mycofactocin-dependent oxidoreductase [Actinocorallia herbida]|uniref:SDR family mycofactocin-dependent oxidoreductase n=1 Tax=Actinocorallia herbida TaxID=58109 RepID=A0A3N1CXF0_9ACTN|nr:mycofactocin-coupled SDR family oxidoreductase [Actinocorallia herbida]ROO85944.1 SDR family mycofactocin-dependent oxidoreductase [Actinocorallia herbida]
MPGRHEGKVAFITGAARGQGRSHAVRLAEEGADIIAVDICKQIDSVPIPMSTPEDLQETVEQVERLGRRIYAVEADVRDLDALTAAADEGVSRFGRLDIVIANAGLAASGDAVEKMDPNHWKDSVDVNLTGVWHTARATVQHVIDGGRGGSVVLTSSVGGLKAHPFIANYVSTKHGIVGLMRTMAVELAPHSIRVNSVHPTQVNTPMLINDMTFRMFRPDLENPTAEDMAPISQMMNSLPVPWVEAVDISNAIVFLTSEEGRYITGVTLPIDAGALLK